MPLWMIIDRNYASSESAGDDYWSNDFGWTDVRQADVYTQQEYETLRLPVDGEWVPLDWVEQRHGAQRMPTPPHPPIEARHVWWREDRDEALSPSAETIAAFRQLQQTAVEVTFDATREAIEALLGAATPPPSPSPDEPRYVLVSSGDPDETTYWREDYGWVDNVDMATRYSDHQRDGMPLRPCESWEEYVAPATDDAVPVNCPKCGEDLLIVTTYAFHRLVRSQHGFEFILNQTADDGYALQCQGEGCGWTFGDPELPARQEPVDVALRSANHPCICGHGFDDHAHAGDDDGMPCTARVSGATYAPHCACPVYRERTMP